MRTHSLAIWSSIGRPSARSPTTSSECASARSSVPVGFDGLIVWGRIYNRPFLRCLHGYGLCLWRLSRALEASRVFQRILSMNPNDLHQGVRFCLDDIQQGGRWPETHEGDEATRPRRPGASASSHGDS